MQFWRHVWQQGGQGRIPALATFTLFLAVLLPARVAAETTYYVDWAKGSDTADGLTPGTAWKRAPGDSRAGAGPRAVRLGPGDTLLFKGGAAYRGTVVLRVSGNPDRPVRVVGDGWGSDRATIDGGEPLAARPCRSARDCQGELDWRHLWRLTLPDHAPVDAPVFQAGSVLMPAQNAGLAGPGTARQVLGKRLVIAFPRDGKAPEFAVGMGRPGFLLVSGRHVDVVGFRFVNFADLPAKGPFAGAPIAGLQPVDGLRLAGLVRGDGVDSVPYRQAVASGRTIAGFVRGPA